MATLLYDSAGTGSYTTLATAIAAATAVDDLIAVKNTSSEGPTASVTHTISATHTPAKPLKIWCVSDFDADPSGLSTGAKLFNTSTTTATFAFAGNLHMYGLDIRHYAASGTGAISNLHSTTLSGLIIVENCKIGASSNSTAASCVIGSGASSNQDAYRTILNDVAWAFGNVSQSIRLSGGTHVFNNLSLEGSISPTTLFGTAANLGLSDVTVRNSDLTGKAWTNLLTTGTTSGQLSLKLENCKLPASFNWYTGTPIPFINLVAVNCGSADVNYNYYELQGDSGTIITTASIYATTSPITDGGVSISDAFTTFSSCGRGNPLLHSYEVVVANDTAANPFVEVLVLGDGAAALKTTELYIQVEALATDGTTLGVCYTSHPGLLDPGTTNCAAGTTAYTGDSYATERTHRVTVPTFTTRQAGRVRITVCLAKASSGIFVGNYGV